MRESGHDDEIWVFAGSNDGDLTSRQAAATLFAKVQPTHVLHLAAKVGGLYANANDNVGFWRQNMAIQDNINTLCQETEVIKLVSCLSTCVFPDKVTYPIEEEFLHQGPPHPSNEGYAYAKRMVDVQNRLYRAQFGCHFTSVVPTNVYGKYDNFSLQGGHVIPCLIHKCHIAQLTNSDFVVLGSGRPLRQFIYSKDLARLMIWALKEYDDPTPIIFSDTEEMSIAQVARMIAIAFDFKGKIIFDDTKSDGQLRKTVSNSKLMTHLPSFEFTPMSDALSETIQWFSQNFDVARK
ncbi:hypothetical protein WJX82_009142 [Trebouxia sp. C0006]